MTDKKEIPDLLKQFAKQPGCGSYTANSSKVELLIDYLWLRQLDPVLTFESFLERYAAVADYSPENLKHPRDAIEAFCPRNKAKAATLGRDQWTAEQVVDFVSLFIDMIRVAEESNTPVPVSFPKFLSELGKPYLAGELTAQSEAAPAAPVASAATTPPATAAAATPSPAPATAPPVKSGRGKKAGSAPVFSPKIDGRAIYTNPHGQQYLVTVKNISVDGEHTYVHFITDAGEFYRDVAVTSLGYTDYPPPNPPVDSEGVALPLRTRISYTIPATEFKQMHDALLFKPTGAPPAMDAVLFAIPRSLSNGQVEPKDDLTAMFVAKWSETGPWLDSYLEHQERVIAEETPRTQLEGVYTFEIRDGEQKGLYVVELTRGA